MFKSIVVGTDGSGTATVAVREAVDVAKAVGATLELVSAYAPVPEQRWGSPRCVRVLFPTSRSPRGRTLGSARTCPASR